MRSRRSPSFPSGLEKKKKKERKKPRARRRPEGSSEAAGVAATAVPGSPSPVGARAGTRRPPGPSARRAAGTIRTGPRRPRVRARRGAAGLAPARRGPEGRGGSAWKSGCARAPAARGPGGRGPWRRGSPRGAPGALAEGLRRRPSGTFCCAGPALLAAPGRPATSAAAAARVPARQSRGGGAGGLGERGCGRRRWRGGGPGRPAGRAFPLPSRVPAGTTSSSPAARSPARPPPQLPRPGRTFRVGRTERKKFRRRGRPGRALGGGDPAWATAAAPALLRCRAGRTARPRGSAFLSLPRALPSARGELGRGAREAGARPGPSWSGRPEVARLPASSPRLARGGRGLRGHGPESSARSPRAEPRAHPPPGARSAPATEGGSRTWSQRVRAGAGACSLLPPGPVLFRRRPE